MLVSIPPEIQERIVAEFVRDGRDHEIAWGVFGRRHESYLSVFCIVRCEKNPSLNQTDIDHDKLMQAAAFLLAGFGDVDLLGIVHSHPHSGFYPSATDHQADVNWLRENDDEIGLFGIVCTHSTATVLNWFVLKSGVYSEAQVEHDKGTAWQAWQKEVDQ